MIAHTHVYYCHYTSVILLDSITWIVYSYGRYLSQLLKIFTGSTYDSHNNHYLALSCLNLQLQNEGASTKQFQSSPTPAPPSPRDFPALVGLDTMSVSALSSRTTLSGESRSVPDFAAVVRKQAAQQAAQLQFERDSGVDLSLGPVRGPGGGGFRNTRVALNDRLEPFHLHGHEVHQAPPATWLETGDSVGKQCLLRKV